MLSEFIGHYEDRIPPVDETVAVWAARFRTEARKRGRPIDLGDALFAGTDQGLRLVARDEERGGFQRTRTRPHEPVGFPLSRPACASAPQSSFRA